LDTILLKAKEILTMQKDVLIVKEFLEVVANKSGHQIKIELNKETDPNLKLISSNHRQVAEIWIYIGNDGWAEFRVNGNFPSFEVKVAQISNNQEIKNFVLAVLRGK